MAKNARKLKDIATKAVNKGKYEKALDAYLALEQLEPDDGSWARRAADMYRRLKRNPEAVVAFERAADKYAAAGFLVKSVAVCKMLLQIEPSHSATQERLAALQETRGVSSRRTPVAKPALSSSEAEAAPAIDELAPAPALDGGGDEFEIMGNRNQVRIEAEVPEPAAIEVDVSAQSDAEIEISFEAEADVDTGQELPPAVALPEVVMPPLESPPPRRRTIPPGAPLEKISLGDLVAGAQPQLKSDGTSSGMIEIPLELDLDDIEELEIELSDCEDEDSTREAAMSLQETPLFSALSPDSLQSFINKIVLVELDQGDTLFKQGESGRTLYVVVEGAVAVVNEGPPRVQLSRLGEGDFFGEIALVTEQPRSATIEAIEETQLLAIDRDVIGDLVDDEPEVLKVLLRFLRDRLLHSLTATSPLFAPFAGAERDQLASSFRFLEADPDSVLITQGEKAEGLFVLLSGNAEVVMTTDDDGKRLATLAPGDLCGEMSLLANGPAVATVRTKGKAFLLELPRAKFRQMIMTHPQVLVFVGDLAAERQRKYEAILRGDAEYETGHLDLV